MSLLRRQDTRRRTIELPAIPAVGVELPSIDAPAIVDVRDALTDAAVGVGRRSMRTATTLGRHGARAGARLGRSTARVAGRGAARGWRDARRRPRVAVGIVVVVVVTLGLVVVLRRRATAQDEALERRLHAVA